LVTEEVRASEQPEASSDGPQVTDTEILVRFHDDFDVAAHLEAERDLTGPSLIGQLGDGFVSDSQLFEVPLTSPTHCEMLVSHYQSLDVVDIASPNAFVQLAALPNDPQVGSQWGLDAINAPAAWDIRTDSSEIIVAVADSGVLSHPDLEGNRWINRKEVPYNDIDDDGNGYVDDLIGWDGFFETGKVPQASGEDFHGVKVAGVVLSLIHISEPPRPS